MSLKSNFELMSQYNQWMNSNIYKAASKLSTEKIKEDRGAFFKSILGTLNHIMVADLIWLKRFAQHPKQYAALNCVPELTNQTSLNQILYEDFFALQQSRKEIDEIIINWCQEIEAADLNSNLEYTNTKGKRYIKNFGSLIQHFFNHQTHHRGQASTLLNQYGIDLGVTDLLMIIPNKEERCKK